MGKNGLNHRTVVDLRRTYKWGSRFEWNSRPIENELEAEIVRLEKRIKELEEKLAYEQEIWHNIYSGEAKGL